MGEWKERANKRRDERHTALEVRAPSSNKKDTKKWCRGRVGREHKLACIGHNRIKDWKILACTECGKHMDHYWPNPWRKSDEPAPEWVQQSVLHGTNENR